MATIGAGSRFCRARIDGTHTAMNMTLSMTEGMRGNPILVSALAISVGLHLIVLAVRFVDPELFRPAPAAAPPLEVILVNARSEKRPQSPQAHAQVNLDGGGANEEGRRTSPLPNSATIVEGDSLESARKTVAQLEQEQRALLAAYEANKLFHTAQPRNVPTPPSPQDASRPQQQLARMQAEIAKEISDYQKRPRVHHFMPSASEYRFARYFEDWRARIEKVGNEHYPDAARGKIYGTLRMTVVIDRSGTLLDAIIEQSSGSPVLDNAARRIVKLSAPFPPFPPDMARDTDRLEITRSWIFTNDQFATRADAGDAAH
jgi:protein TonB